MKQLLLIRHAKASHDSDFTDFERPLKQSGIADATLMAERTAARGAIPQLMVSSPSLRTLTTANIFTEHLSLPAPVLIKEIYDASTKTLLNVIENLPEAYNFIALSGHNPAISDVLYYLTGKYANVPPGTVALINFEADSWQMISEDSGDLSWYSSPKDEA